MKEALHINWKKPNLNAEQNLSFLFLIFDFAFIFYVLFSRRRTLIIAMMYLVNNISARQAS